MSRLTYEECESLLASTTDLLNTWARESSVTQAYDEKDIRGVVDRLWSNLTLRISKVERERDEAIVGAYRAAADVRVGGYKGTPLDSDKEYARLSQPFRDAILALAPQSALDAVERNRREIASSARLGLMYEVRGDYHHMEEEDRWHAFVKYMDAKVAQLEWEAGPLAAAEVLAKVGRGR